MKLLILLYVTSLLFCKNTSGLVCFMCNDLYGNNTESCADPFNPNGPEVFMQDCPESNRCSKNIIHYSDSVFYIRNCYNMTREAYKGCKEVGSPDLPTRVRSVMCLCSNILCNSGPPATSSCLPATFILQLAIISFNELYI